MSTEDLEHSHAPEDIRERLESGPSHSYLRDWVYGGIDGAVTTFAIVTGVVGAELSARVVLILGVANLVGDGFSMAAGNYSATQTELQQIEHIREIEYRHIRVDPDGEREEVRQIFASKGFEGEDLESAVSVVTGDDDRWVDTMLTDEYGLPLEVRSPLRAATATFFAFILCGIVPLVPWYLGISSPFDWSVGMTLAVFFGIGSLRSRWSIHPWWRTGLSTLAIGSIAAGLAYAIGYLLRSLGV
ncbi:MAG: VIT1/CCC1 transporter family protein [Acidobacteria bacterium]|nr:VIT1/CCC1 transporter family protein [Acidobacteriota bacterium]